MPPLRTLSCDSKQSTRPPVPVNPGLPLRPSLEGRCLCLASHSRMDLSMSAKISMSPRPRCSALCLPLNQSPSVASSGATGVGTVVPDLYLDYSPPIHPAQTSKGTRRPIRTPTASLTAPSNQPADTLLYLLNSPGQDQCHSSTPPRPTLCQKKGGERLSLTPQSTAYQSTVD